MAAVLRGALAQVNDAGGIHGRQLKLVVRDPGTSYSTHCDIFNQNPDGPANWTPTTVNSALVGVEIAA